MSRIARARRADLHPLSLVFLPPDSIRQNFICQELIQYFECRICTCETVATDDFDGEDLDAAALLMVVGQEGLGACCDLLEKLRHAQPKIPLMAITDGVSTDGIARLLESGAFDFADLRGSPSELLLRVRRSAGMLASLRDARANDSESLVDNALRSRLIGNSPTFMGLLRRVSAMARSSGNVMVLGETGTGKEACAQAIHYCSSRARGPWVAINCAAIPAELVEDELYGHVRGAYTHAHTRREGLVREAEGGTLFLDEVDSLPIAAQAKLLRFLEDGEYRAVGSSSVRHADVRIIAASNHDLKRAVSSGQFREDLFFRLNVLTLTVPPLRERREDISVLAAHFFDQANREADPRLLGISPAALRLLVGHEWPGNVRELKHVVQRGVVLAEGSMLGAADIEIDGQATVEGEATSFREAKAQVVKTFERSYLEAVLTRSGGNISLAARAAKKNRRAFFELLRRHEIDASRFRLS